jgi:hypothetical protein
LAAAGLTALLQSRVGGVPPRRGHQFGIGAQVGAAPEDVMGGIHAPSTFSSPAVSFPRSAANSALARVNAAASSLVGQCARKSSNNASAAV